jgi:tetratricopeptide (TPR) repeat protein
MGLAYLARSRGAEALGSLRRSQVLAETLNRPRRDALLQMHIGRALHLVGEHDAAVVSLRAGRQSLAALGDRYSAGRAAMYLAAPYWALGQRETARQVVLDARATMRELDAIGAEADAARQLADLTDDVQASRGYLEEALTLYRRIGSRTAEDVERQLNPGAPA